MGRHCTPSSQNHVSGGPRMALEARYPALASGTHLYGRCPLPSGRPLVQIDPLSYNVGLMKENGPEIPNKAEQEFARSELGPGFLSPKEQGIVEYIIKKFAREGQPWFMAFANLQGVGTSEIATKFSTSENKVFGLVQRAIVKVAWTNGDLLDFLGERRQRILCSYYLAQPRQTCTQIAKEEGTMPSLVGCITTQGPFEVLAVWHCRWENLPSSEVSRGFPEFYRFTPAMPTWFSEIDLLGLEPQTKSNLVENGFDQLVKLDEANHDKLSACGLKHPHIIELKIALEEFANILNRFQGEKETEVPEDILNNQSILQKEVPPYFLDRRLKNRWWRFTEVDLLGLATRERNCVRRVGICSIRDFDQMTDDDLLTIRGLGHGGLRKIRARLREVKQRLGLFD